MFWPLMKSAITESDKIKLIEFIASTDKFTCGEKVTEFEKTGVNGSRVNILCSLHPVVQRIYFFYQP